MTEQWKDVPGYEGFYQVSDAGRVRSVDREVGHPSGGTKTMLGQEILQATLPGGYKIVSLYKKSERKNWRVNRLVLMAFVGMPIDGMASCHCDNDPTNNKLSNLRWDTYKGNESDKLANGTHLRGERSHFAILSEIQVIEIKARLALGHQQKKMAEEFGVSPSTITAIKKGRAWAYL